MKKLSFAFGRKPYRSRRRSLHTVAAEVGQVESLETRALLAFDFGDAPDSTAGTAVQDYQTRLARNGPRHQLSSSQTNLFLGASVDADPGTSQSVTAGLDDQFTAGGRDDEDGVLNSMDLNGTVGADPGITLSATNKTGKAATLYGWIDFNHNGIFENATERASITVQSESINERFTLTFPTAPAGSAGKTYARFRLSTDVAAASSTGAAADGEVEDYQFVMQNRVRQPVEVTKSVRIGNEINGGPVTTGSDLFGAASAAIGDLDGDGVTDMAIGAPQDDEGGSHRGAVQIMFLNSDGTAKKTVKIAHELNGGPALADADGFGVSIASLGDVNGDGVVDLAVGATGDDTGGLNRGAVYIIQLNADGTAKGNNKIASSINGGPTLGDEDGFGIVAPLGDFDGDGVVDIVVGAPFADAGGVDRGEIHILKLQTDGTVKSFTKIQNSASWNPTVQDHEYFGLSITNLGDLDGDGVVDLAVAAMAHRYYSWYSAESSLQMLRLNADGTIKSYRVLSSPLGSNHSDRTSVINGVAAPGDVNGDGVNDIVFAVDGVYGNSRDEGWLVLAYLNPDGTMRSYSRIGSGVTGATGFENSTLTRSSISLLGDLNGDGTAELAIGAPNYGTTRALSESVFVLSLLNAVPNIEIPSVPVLQYVGVSHYIPQAVILWNGNDRATGYEIWLRNLTTGMTLLNAVNNSTTGYTLPEEFGIGRYEFYVRAKNEVGTSAWSQSLAFTINGPVTVNETPDGIPTRPTLSWQALPGAAKYDIWLNDTRTPLTPLVKIRTSDPLTTFVPSSDLADASYRFQVRGVAADGTLGQWSKADIFAVKTTTLIVQVSNEFTHRPNLEWTAIPGAASYEVWIRTLPSGAVRGTTNVVGEHTVFTPDTDLAPGNYQAWIRPVAADSSHGLWSPARSFASGAIANISTNISEIRAYENFILPIPEITGAVSVDVWIDDPEPGVASSAIAQKRYSVEWPIAIMLSTQGKYRIWIRPVAADGTTGQWSSAWTLTAKNTPNAWLYDAVFRWEGVPGVQKYQIRAIDSDTSAVTLMETNPSELSMNLAGFPLGRLTIAVRAVSADGIESDWSQPLAYVSRPWPEILLPTPTLPTTITSDTTPKLQWTHVLGAVSYDVVVRTARTKHVQFAVRGIEATSYISPKLPLGDYELWVIPNAASGFRGTWNLERFQVIGPRTPFVIYEGPPEIEYGNLDLSVRWTNVLDADHYDVWIADSQGVVVVRDLNVLQTSYRLTRSIPPEFYLIWVRTVYADGSISPWSRPEWFEVS